MKAVQQWPSQSPISALYEAVTSRIRSSVQLEASKRRDLRRVAEDGNMLPVRAFCVMYSVLLTKHTNKAPSNASVMQRTIEARRLYIRDSAV